MKLVLAVTALAATPLLVPSPQNPTTATAVPLGLPQRSLLGNGGFETWTHGTSANLALGPDLWLAQGTTSNFTTQSAIDFVRVPEDPACTSGAPWSAQLSAMSPGNFVSQRLEDFAGLDDRWVTFTVWLRTDFPVAYPTIAIDDGHAATTESRGVGQVFGTQRYTPLTVRHKVSKCATKLEFKIVPDQTIQVANAMAVVGNVSQAVYVPRRNVEPGLMELPLGAVVDWYRFHADMPVPEGFVICDGSTITDPESTFVGRAVPDLRGKFVRGAPDLASIGSGGGTDTVDLQHSHSGSTGANQSPGTDYWFMAQNQLDQLHNAKDEHTHTFTTNEALGTVSLVPSYVGLLKIMRVR